MLGRFFRIYPVYLVCLLLAFACAGLSGFIMETASWRDTSYFTAIAAQSANEQAAPLQHLAAHLTLTHGTFPRQVLPDSAATLLVPAWSISVEWQYYVCALLVARFARSAVGLIGLAGISWYALRHGDGWINPLPAFFPLVLPLFLIGIGSYHLYATFVANGARRSKKYTLLVAAAVAGAIMFQWHSLALAIWAAAFGSLFVERSGWASRALGAIRAALGHSWIQLLGRMSYPLYLVHWPLIILSLAALLYFKPAVHFGEAVVWLVCAALPLILGAAYLLHRSIEAPCMRLGKHLTARSSRGREIAATAAHAGGPMATVVKPAGIVIAAPRDLNVPTQPRPE